MPLVSATGLSRRYLIGTGEIRALDGLDLEVAEGELVAVVGPSRSGKPGVRGADRPAYARTERSRRRSRATPFGPDAVELAHVGNERHTPLLDPEQRAFEGHISGSQPSVAAVHDLHRDRLPGMGWRRHTFGAFSSSTEAETWVWCKPGVTFRISDAPRVA